MIALASRHMPAVVSSVVIALTMAALFAFATQDILDWGM